MKQVEHRAASAPRSHIGYLDLLKCYATILVLIVHIAAAGCYGWGAIPARTWWVATAYDSFARSCVPLFLMASGATLLDTTKTEPVGRFIIRRLQRVLLPLLIWSVVYQMDRVFLMGQPLTLDTMWRDLRLGTSFYHLPFFYYLLGLYLCAPVFARFADAASSGAAKYFAILWFVISCQILASDFSAKAVGVSVPVVMGFAGYFVMGRLLRDVAVSRRGSILCGAVLLAATMLTLLGTFALTRKAGHLNEMLFEYGRPNVVLMTVATFLLLSSSGVRAWLQARPRLGRSLQAGAALTFGIYLIHPLLLQIVIPWIGLSWTTITPLVGIPLTAGVLLVMSGAVVWGLTTVRWLRVAVA